MPTKEKIVVENIVASGKLTPELDLEAVAEDLQNQKGIKEVEHSRRSGNRLLVYFKNNDALCILAPTAVYVFTGVDEFEDMDDAKSIFLNALAQMGIISSSDLAEDDIKEPFKIQNLVCTGNLNSELNLEALSIYLGLEVVEYEPEQFPGLVYKPEDAESTILLFASGKAVVTGITDRETAQETFDSVRIKINELFD